MLWITCCGERQSVSYNDAINKWILSLSRPHSFNFHGCRQFFRVKPLPTWGSANTWAALQSLLQWRSRPRFLRASSPLSHCWEPPMSRLKLRRCPPPTCTRSALSLPSPALLSLSKLNNNQQCFSVFVDWCASLCASRWHAHVVFVSLFMRGHWSFNIYHSSPASIWFFFFIYGFKYRLFLLFFYIQ